MKIISFSLCIMVALFAPTNIFAEVKLLVKYNGDKHEIVKAVRVEDTPRSFLEQYELQTDQKHKAVVNYSLHSMAKTQPSIEKIAFDDPRILRAPMSKSNGGHEHVFIQTKGVYYLTLPNDAQLDSLKVKFPQTQKAISLSLSDEVNHSSQE